MQVIFDAASVTSSGATQWRSRDISRLLTVPEFVGATHASPLRRLSRMSVGAQNFVPLQFTIQPNYPSHTAGRTRDPY